VVKEAVEHGADRVVLDMDSARVRFMASKRAAPINGHFESVCYHPLFPVQPSRGLLGGEAATRQRAQRRSLGQAAASKPFENLTGLGCRAICDLTEGLLLRLWKMEIPT
jgi:hypothetical protein